MSRIIFITGSDTDVGKTVATGLLLYNLRRRGIKALAVKPFCSATRNDIRRLHALQDGELSFEEINPWFFRLPLAPMVAARRLGREMPRLQDVGKHIQRMAQRCDVLLVEGAGGVLVPLGVHERQAGSKPAIGSRGGPRPALRAFALRANPFRGGSQQIENLRYGKWQMAHCYTVADLIAAFDAAVLVVARNRLGTINHTLLTMQPLPFFEAGRVAVVLMEQRRPDLSSKTNPGVLRELLDPIKVFSVPYLGPNPLGFSALKKNEKKLEKTVAKIFDSAIFSSLFGRKIRTGKRHKKSFDSPV